MTSITRYFFKWFGSRKPIGPYYRSILPILPKPNLAWTPGIKWGQLILGWYYSERSRSCSSLDLSYCTTATALLILHELASSYQWGWYHHHSSYFKFWIFIDLLRLHGGPFKIGMYFHFSSIFILLKSPLKRVKTGWESEVNELLNLATIHMLHVEVHLSSTFLIRLCNAVSHLLFHLIFKLSRQRREGSTKSVKSFLICVQFKTSFKIFFS